MISNYEKELNIESVIIPAQNRQLKAVLTRESVQDLKSHYNLDAMDELSKIMAKEILEEIDNEIINDLKNFSKISKEEQDRLDEEQQHKQFKIDKKKYHARSITEDFVPSKID